MNIDLEIDPMKVWNENYEVLKSQIENNELRSKDKKGKRSPAYVWLTNQKTNYRENKLGKEQIEKLKALGVLGQEVENEEQ